LSEDWIILAAAIVFQEEIEEVRMVEAKMKKEHGN
jgi:hypothetical protein